jgi:hypothetical protein
MPSGAVANWHGRRRHGESRQTKTRHAVRRAGDWSLKHRIAVEARLRVIAAEVGKTLLLGTRCNC